MHDAADDSSDDEGGECGPLHYRSNTMEDITSFLSTFTLKMCTRFSEGSVSALVLLETFTLLDNRPLYKRFNRHRIPAYVNVIQDAGFNFTQYDATTFIESITFWM